MNRINLDNSSKDGYTLPPDPGFSVGSTIRRKYTNEPLLICSRNMASPIPSQNDNVSTFTDEAYGWYFTEKYKALVDQGSASELDVLYVEAFIEELGMMDINQCPKVIVETDNGIDDISECGKIYTDRTDIQRLFGSLLEDLKNHLRSCVKSIEKQIGEDNYKAQVISQEEVDAILGH